MVYGIKEQREAIQARAAHLRRAGASIRRLKPVIRSFDGKVYNKRFNEAINAAGDETNRFYCHDIHGFYHISWNEPGARYSDDITVLTGYSCTGSQKDRPDDQYKIFDGKRIISDKMIEELTRKYEAIQAEAYKLETAAQDLEETLTRIKETKELYNHLVNSLPSFITDICGLKRFY